MSESEKTKNVPVVKGHSDRDREQKNLTRRGMLLGAVLGGIGAVKTVEAVECTCLPAPDCNAVCPNGGVPRGDGTQACDCNPPTCVTQDQLAKVAYTGEYTDLIDKPDLSAGMPNVVTAGGAGPTTNVTMSRTGAAPQTGKITIPYFSVDSKGRVTAFGNRTFEMKTSYYSNYSNYYAYSNYSAYTNYNAYQNYSNYKNYYDYYDNNCCGDSDGR